MSASAVEWGVHCPRATEKDKKEHKQRVISMKPLALECVYCHGVQVPNHQYSVASRKQFLTDYACWRPRPVKGVYW